MDAMDSNRYTIDERCKDDSKYCASLPYKLAVSILTCGTALTPGQTFSAPLVLNDNKDIKRLIKDITSYMMVMM